MDGNKMEITSAKRKKKLFLMLLWQIYLQEGKTILTESLGVKFGPTTYTTDSG